MSGGLKPLVKIDAFLFVVSIDIMIAAWDYLILAGVI